MAQASGDYGLLGAQEDQTELEKLEILHYSEIEAAVEF